MRLVCLDVEGVVLPEIWINVAKFLGIKELELTTRDEPDYDKLMRNRLRILHEHRVGLPDIEAVIAKMDPLPGACEFLDSLRNKVQVVLLSDTFAEFARGIMRKLNNPTLFCNSLVVDEHNFISDYVLRQNDGKKKAVIAFKSLNFEVAAAGDSYNDLSMIRCADRGALFKAPRSIIEQNADVPSFTDYNELTEFLLGK